MTLVITDIQGSTTLWDRFPSETATDIARHHEAARAKLADFNGRVPETYRDAGLGPGFVPSGGLPLSQPDCFRVRRYEVATEGDSFICAFHNPEDAVCWSICFQVHC